VIELYAVRRVSDGLYYRPGDHYEKWVELKRAKVYPRIGPAKAAVTSWAGYGTKTNLVRLLVTEVRVIDLTEDIQKAKLTKERKLKRQEIRSKQDKIERLEKQKLELEEQLTKLQGSE